jgi:hypothetical protein
MLACGPDSRLEFVGTYKGALTVTVSYSDGSSRRHSHGEQVVVIAAPEDSDDLTFPAGSCGMTARVRNDDAFIFNKSACPTREVRVETSAGDVYCDLIETIEGGTGTVSTRRPRHTLALSYFGEAQLVRCSDGGPSDTAKYISEMVLTRQ